jgi:hypothetical protein
MGGPCLDFQTWEIWEILITPEGTLNYTYDLAGNVSSIYSSSLHGASMSYTYDSLNRLTSLASSTASYSYQLGATGNRTGATEQNGRTLTWNYDGIYRLTNEAISNDPSGANGAVAYGLDPVGNRTATNSSLPGVHSVSLSGFNLDDWLSPETYDANGNTLTTGGKLPSLSYSASASTMRRSTGIQPPVFTARQRTMRGCGFCRRRKKQISAR